MLTRTEAGDELAARAGAHLIAVGLTTADSTGHLKEPLDDTFRALGVAWVDLPDATVDEADLNKFLAVGTVFVLRRALGQASGFADVAATTLGTSKRKSQIVANLEKALERATAHALQYGLTDLVPVMTSGTYRIDLLEPEEVV